MNAARARSAAIVMVTGGIGQAVSLVEIGVAVPRMSDNKGGFHSQLSESWECPSRILSEDDFSPAPVSCG